MTGSPTRSKRAARKAGLREILLRRDFAELAAWSMQAPNPTAVLIPLLFADDDLLRWRTIEALGRLIGRQAADNPELVRDQLRRLFWSMNDESGNLIWHAPEAIGEILANAPELAAEYTRQLLSFLVEEPFERGTYWAVARLSGIAPEAFVEGTEKVLPGLSDPDPAIRGYALLAVIAFNLSIDDTLLDELRDDTAPLPWYDFSSGELTRLTVAKIAGQIDK